MENQMNVADQNTQQIGQNQVSQPVMTPENPKANYLMIGGIILVCFVIFGFGGFYLGKQSSNSTQYAERQNQVTTEASPAPLQISKSKSEYEVAIFQGHYFATPIKFSYKYPVGWHVKYDSEIKGDQKPENIINKISMNPVPLVISEFGKFAIDGKSLLSSESPSSKEDYLASLKKNCPVPAGENKKEFSNDFNCIIDYSPKQLEYKLFDPQGYCYMYKTYEGSSGINQEYTSCIVAINNTKFIFTFNDSQYSSEFKEFVESIKPIQ